MLLLFRPSTAGEHFYWCPDIHHDFLEPADASCHSHVLSLESGGAPAPNWPSAPADGSINDAIIFSSSDGGRTGTEPRKNQEKFASGIWVRERERIFVAGIRFVWKMHRTLRGASAAWIRDVWRLVKGDEDGGVVYGAASLRPWGVGWMEKGTFLFVIFRGPDWPSAPSRRSANGSGPLSRHVCYEI